MIIRNLIKQFIYNKSSKLSVVWVKKSKTSWLASQFPGDFYKSKKSVYSDKIEKIASMTNKLGRQPIWSGYLVDTNVNQFPTRIPDEVRTPNIMGDLYTNLVICRKPKIIVEFGTAFGVSGMYFLAGLESIKQGKLFTFEPNSVWANIAKNNLIQISNRFKLIVGKFEENIDKQLVDSRTIDITFIDAIHQSQYLIPQINIVLERSSPGAFIILDDISFSEDMKGCWNKVSDYSMFSASVLLSNRVGILELR